MAIEHLAHRGGDGLLQCAGAERAKTTPPGARRSTTLPAPLPRRKTAQLGLAPLRRG
jgi:hypothetical protein